MIDHIQGHDIEESVYRADDAWAASDLKYGIDNGLEALQIRKFGKDIPPRIATSAMKFGSMIHKFVLEPTEFPDCYALLDDKRTKKGKETALALQEGGIQTFTTPEMDQMLGMHNALSKNDFAKLEATNDHTEAAVKLINMFGTKEEKFKMSAIKARHNMTGYITGPDSRERLAMVNKYYSRLK